MNTLQLQNPCQSEKQITLVDSADETELSPEELAVACQAGCQDSFERLVALFEGRIFNFLWRLTGNQHDAEDLTQDTFVKVYRNIQRYQPVFAFSTWLFTIAKRTAYSHLRRSKPSEELALEDEPDLEDPSVLLQRKDDGDSVWSVARKLKPNQYEALWLRYGEGFSVAETAQIMNTNQIHVKVLLHRGRQHLAKQLKGVETGLFSRPAEAVFKPKPTASGE
ncbi:MAG: RNA polymerase sigma factor [Verrucomicrobia bacterium]|nr:RNA polymerase sigma factor [Verrucomicrobiota bacterium]